MRVTLRLQREQCRVAGMKADKEEVQRLLDVLRTLLRMLGISNREVERRLELKHSAVTRLFGGQVEAKLELVLGIVQAVGLGHDEFFAFAYPERRAAEEETAAARRIRTLLEDLHPKGIRAAPPAEKRPAAARPAPAAQAVDRDEMLRDLKKVVREVLGEIQSQGKPEPKPENGDD
jgi:transcriptional regulator with XRE-family HTH domain